MSGICSEHKHEQKDCPRCRVVGFITQLAQKDAEIARLRHVAENAESFCTWLCEDSKKYPGTDAGDAARRLRQDLRKALSASKGDEA